MLKAYSYKSFNLNVLNLLHGDIGSIKENDLLIIISKSGNTKEIYDIIKILEKRKCKIVLLTMNKNHKIICNNVILLPDVIELDNFNLFPSTSLCYFSIFFNIICKILSKDFTIEEYNINHLAGDIGKYSKIDIRQIMNKDLNEYCSNINNTLKDMILKFNHYNICSQIITKSDYTMIGFITDYDIRNSILKHDINIPIDKIMSKNPFYINIDITFKKLLSLLKNNNYHHMSGIPIIENNKVIGLLTHRIIVKYII